MSKLVLIGAAILSGVTSLAANEIAAPTAIAPKAGVSKTAAFDQACLAAIAFTVSGRYDQVPLSGWALANVRMCNGHPSQSICETTSQTLLREYGKTPLTCGSNAAEALPLFLPAEQPTP